MGGHRNWDYRYCWLRDSTFTVLALLHAGYPEEAEAWINWLIRAIAPKAHRTRTFYGVIPHTEINEFEASWLSGFNGSRPVRFGNSARDQIQLGIYGEVQDTLHQWRMSVEKPEESVWQDQCDMLHRLVSLVGKPDAGIWEQRGHLEMFTQSQALAWVGLDRAIKSADRFDFTMPGDWRLTRANLHNAICTKGFDSELGSFTRAYGSRSFDASCLLLAMTGFLPADDVRIKGTVHAIRRHLSAGPFVYRYDASLENDGVGGSEGAFLPCSFWLADNLILQRHEDAAAAIFEGVLGAANDLGLYSEEYNVSCKTLLGNFPQALTHLSHIHTALNLTGVGPAHNRSKAGY
jgi:GH15 family glucan-1,4-alpha-glucosidase